jgi:beta-glucosidase
MRSSPSASLVAKVSLVTLIVAAACTHAQAPTGDDDDDGTSGTSGAGNSPNGGANNGGTGNTSGTTSGASGTTPTGGTGTGGSAGTPATGGSAGTEVIIQGGAAGMGGMPTGGTGMKMSCADATYSDKYTPGQQATPDPAAAAMLQRMNLTQRIAQMQGTPPGTESSKNYDDIQRSPDDTTNMVRGYMYRDGPRGVNLDARQQGRPFMNNYATAFPQVSARGASWDLELEYRIGEAMGDETIASQNTMMLAPCMNILRHPAWGRSQETYGEDVFLLGRMASAYTAGLQTYVAGCAKHYAGNNIEASRAANNAVMDEQTLREIYGRHFEMVVREGGVACIMAAYNLVNGTKSTQHRHLLTEILRDDFGFKGFVLSDWWAMPSDQNFPTAAAAQSNAADAANAGLDVEVPWNLNYAQLQTVVEGGRVQASVIETSARRILEQKYRFKSALLGQPIGLKTPRTTMTNGSITNNDMHIALSQEAAVKSMVLLKNENNTLPIRTPMRGGMIDKIAVVGADVAYTLQNTTPMGGGTMRFATDQPLGDRGSSRVNSDPAKTTGPTAGITAAAMRNGATVVSGNSAAAVADADFVVVVVGLTPGDEGEEYAIPSGGDRANFQLSGSQNQLVTSVAALGKPFVVVIQSGSVIEMPWLAMTPAVVAAWYPGQAGGAALGQLLFGEANFSGKLPVTWGNYADYGPFKDSNTSTNMGYFLGYRRFDQMGLTPLYYFGHGLSYSTFTYSNLQVPCSDVTKNGVVNVTVDIQNTSMVPGEEVAFLFVGFPSAARRTGLAAGYKELKGFYKVQLDAMQAKRITIPLRVADLKYWSGGATGSWMVESGMHTIMVGPSAKPADLMLRDTLLVQ